LFDWLGGILSGLGDAIGIAFENATSGIVDSIWTALVQWLYTSIYDAIADLFTGINNMGAGIFTLSWVTAVVDLFRLFGWALFAAGVVVAVFDIAIESQSGRVNVKTAALNILKGFFACGLVSVVPIELYKFCVTLQNTFAGDLTRIFAGSQAASFGEFVAFVLRTAFLLPDTATAGLKLLCFLIAFAYCTIKVFFANIKRGGILLTQMAVGELYMFSLPRGFDDGFNQWCKQVAAICLTAFLQTTLLFLGMMSFQTDMLLGMGIMLAANEVPRIAQQFGLDSSVRVNMMSVFHTTSTAVNLTKALTKAK
jgi:hypothetical protein